MRSPFFAKIFRTSKSAQSTHSFGLPDDEDEPFQLFVGWLYSNGVLPPPQQESDLGPLLDLYLMAERWGVVGLVRDVLALVRAFYARTDSFPGLRRVQYVYANTAPASPMRALLVGAVARMLVVGEGEVPQHWEKALGNNGRLAVDIILAMRSWHLKKEEVPDVREEPVEEDVSEEEVVPKEEAKIKTEEGEQRISMRDGPNGAVNGHHKEDEDEDENEEQQQQPEEKELQYRKKLQAQLPNGINGVNGTRHEVNGIFGTYSD